MISLIPAMALENRRTASNLSVYWWKVSTTLRNLLNCWGHAADVSGGNGLLSSPRW